MKLTQEQQEILNGSRGETMAKVMETLVRYGELYDSDTMIPVTGKNNHLVTSFGLKALTPVYELMDQLIAEGAVSGTKFSADPRPLDKNVPSSFLQNIIFNHFMYSKQDFYEDQLQKLGLMEKDAFTCTCYMDEVGNIPKKGDILSWSESSAVVYANSVLAARCNRHHRPDGGHLRLCAPVRPADRRGPEGQVDRGSAHHQEAGGPASRFCHRHEGHGGCALHQGAG